MQAQKLIGATGALGAVTLAAGTTTTLSTTAAQIYAINGKAYTNTAWTNQATPTTDAATGVAFSTTGVKKGYGSVFVVGLNAAKAMKCCQGSIVALDGTYNWATYPQFPELPDDFCPIGYITILAGSTADATVGWRFGTDNTASVTGITYAFQDVALGMPARPVKS